MNAELQVLNEFLDQYRTVLIAKATGITDEQARRHAVEPSNLSILGLLRHLAEGANINNLKSEHFDELEIPLPPLEQQKKIAAILDAADAYRQKTKALISKYDELTQSLFLANNNR